MNQISDPVFSPGQSVEVTVLGQTSATLVATVIDIDGPALRLHLPQSLPAGTPVKIEGGDALLLADVSFCDATRGSLVASLTVRHMLTALAELTRLGRALCGTDRPVRVEQETAVRR